MSEPKRIGELGNDYFVHSCKRCGGRVLNWSKHDKGYTCKACKVVEKEAEKVKNTSRTFEIAMDFLRRKKLLKRYEEQIPIIEKNLHRPGWFQSSPEIICALELLKNGVKARHQVRMGKWRADFVIPDMKVVLEIDGVLFHQGKRETLDRRKDAEIIAHCGPEWEVIRISDVLLKSNPKRLMKAIETVKEERKRVRKSFNYKMPYWYSEKNV